MNKEFFIRLLINMSVLVSGFGLSLFYVVRIHHFDILMILFAPIVAFIFAPKQYWLRVIVFIFLMAGVYGLGRIWLEVGHKIENMEIILWNKYTTDVLVYLLYGSIWLIWWINDSKKR